jgi:hypothetical protein
MGHIRLGLSISLVVVAVLAALWIARQPTPRVHKPRVWFEDKTAEARIPPYSGQSYGAAWGDVNADGRPDLWVSGHSPQRLLVNQGDGGFLDRAAALVRPIRYSDRHGAAWADLDNDGDEDLVQLSGAGRGAGEDPNTLFVSEGGYLRDFAAQLGASTGQMRR